MTDHEIKPLPWYRSIVTRTPRGRKLRWRLFVALLGLCSPLLLPWSLGFGIWRREPVRPLVVHQERACEREPGDELWVCENVDAGISVAECREILTAIGEHLDAGPRGTISCTRPQNWARNKEKKDAPQAPK